MFGAGFGAPDSCSDGYMDSIDNRTGCKNWCNPFWVNMFFSCGIQRCKSICSDFLSRPDMSAEKITHTAFADFLNRFRRHKSSMFMTSFNRDKNRFLAGGTSATFPRPFTAHKGIIAFNQMLQSINAVAMNHKQTDFPQYALSRYPAHPDMMAA